MTKSWITDRYNDIRWVLDNPEDIIQKQLIEGRWFEQQYLDVMKKYCPDNANILDIGANIGNHSVYFSKYFNANQIISIEPIPRFYKLLLANIAINYCHNINVNYLGVALGDRECTGYPFLVFGKNNLGSMRLNPTPMNNLVDTDHIYAPVNVICGDSLFNDVDVNFIKMDVEGMEMVALDGLKNTIDRYRPPMFIEVGHDNDDFFEQWLINNNYISVYCDRYPSLHSNHMILPA